MNRPLESPVTRGADLGIRVAAKGAVSAKVCPYPRSAKVWHILGTRAR